MVPLPWPWGLEGAGTHLQARLLGLIQGDPELDLPPELLEAHPGVLLEPVRHRGVQPTALLLQAIKTYFRASYI